MHHDLIEVNRPRVIPVAQPAQTIAEPPHILFGQAPPAAGQQNKAEERCRCLGRYDVRFARMRRQPPPREMRGNALAPLEDRLDNGAERVVDDPVAEWRR